MKLFRKQLLSAVSCCVLVKKAPSQVLDQVPHILSLLRNMFQLRNIKMLRIGSSQVLLLENFAKCSGKHMRQSVSLNFQVGVTQLPEHSFEFCKIFGTAYFCHRRCCIKKSKACNFIKKETVAQVFSCESCKIFKNFLFTEQLKTTAFIICRIFLQNF